MTLKEKFKKIDIKLSKNQSTLITNRESAIIETIADEFAVEFADWMVNYSADKDNYIKTPSTKELLEIYKKEKQL